MKKGFTNNRLDPLKFSSVYGLCYHNFKDINQSSEVLKKSIFMAYFFARRIGYLKNKSERNLEMLKKDKNFIFLIELFEKNHLITYYNAYGMEIPTLALTVMKISMAIVPALTFFNHTCDPMMMRHCRDNFIVSTALRPIKQGEQVFECYGPLYYNEGKKERQQYYLDSYNFKCNCEACVDDWPLMSPSKTLSPLPEWNIDYINNLKEVLWTLTRKVRTCADEVDDCFKKKNQFLNTSETQAEIVKMIDETYHIFDKKSLEHFALARSLEQVILYSSKRILFLNQV